MDRASLNKAAISLGNSDIYKEIYNKKTSIIELASNDNNLSNAENLINILLTYLYLKITCQFHLIFVHQFFS